MNKSKIGELWNKGAVRAAVFAGLFVIAVVCIIAFNNMSSETSEEPPIDFNDTPLDIVDEPESQKDNTIGLGDNGRYLENDIYNEDTALKAAEDMVSNENNNEAEVVAENTDNMNVGDTSVSDINADKNNTSNSVAKKDDTVTDTDTTESLAENTKNNIAEAENEVKPDSSLAKETEEKPSDTAVVAEKETPENALEVMKKNIQALSFDEAGGLLWPVKGEVLLNYSNEHLIYHKTLNQFRTNPAVIISAKKGTPVLAAASGIITNIEKAYKTGWTATIAIGNGYSLVYGQLNEPSYKVGDFVAAGDIIGTVAATSKVYSLEGDNLFFQLVCDNETKNPMLFLKE